MPFVTEKVWGALFATTGAVDSVHLASWPEADPTLIDRRLGEQMALVRRLVELGRSARADAKAKTRQPLRQALISAPGWAALPEDLKAQVRDELNVVELASLGDAGELVELKVSPNFRELGRRFGKRTQAVASAIRAVDPSAFVAAYRAGAATVDVDGAAVGISGDEVVVAETPRSGWAVASAGSDTVALDLELTHELRLAGLFREVVRFVQDARKNAGLEVTDRIQLWWRVGGSPEPAEAIRAHRDELAAEVLAVELTEGAPELLDVFASTDESGCARRPDPAPELSPRRRAVRRRSGDASLEPDIEWPPGRPGQPSRWQSEQGTKPCSTASSKGIGCACWPLMIRQSWEW
jgi:isoleucyl-tRNA synthetase